MKAMDLILLLKIEQHFDPYTPQNPVYMQFYLFSVNTAIA